MNTIFKLLFISRYTVDFETCHWINTILFDVRVVSFYQAFSNAVMYYILLFQQNIIYHYIYTVKYE
jgi:hypothetical protein